MTTQQRHTPYFDGTRYTLPTSYDNQRKLAIRDLGAEATCAHEETLGHGCAVCRMSGTPVMYK